MLRSTACCAECNYFGVMVLTFEVTVHQHTAYLPAAYTVDTGIQDLSEEVKGVTTPHLRKYLLLDC